MTGRRWIAYVPGCDGPRIWNVKLASVPGATVVSVCTAGRVVYGQFTASAAHVASSRFTPSRASWPRVPFTHVWLPALRKLIVSGVLTSPMRSGGELDWDTQRLGE